MGAFVLEGGGESQSEDSYVFLRTRPKEDEERQGPRAVDRRRRKATVRERQLPSEKFGPVDSVARSVNARWWVSVPVGCVGISLGYSLAIAHRKLQKSVKTSTLMCLELTQVRACLFFFFSTLSVVYVVSCVFVKQCEMPLAVDERNH